MNISRNNHHESDRQLAKQQGKTASDNSGTDIKKPTMWGVLRNVVVGMIFREIGKTIKGRLDGDGSDSDLDI